MTTSFELDARTAQHLRDDIVLWLTTVRPDGMPQPTPVWFLWEGETFLIYSKPTALKLRNIATNHKVALHLDTDRWGDEVIVISGEASVDPTTPPARQVSAYIEKYREGLARLDMTPESFTEAYSVAIRVKPVHIRTE